MVMPWDLSSLRASSRKAYSNGRAVRAQRSRICSSFPSGSDPVSASRRPITVLFPWSTWPTTTRERCSPAAAAGKRGGDPLAGGWGVTGGETIVILCPDRFHQCVPAPPHRRFPAVGREAHDLPDHRHYWRFESVPLGGLGYRGEGRTGYPLLGSRGGLNAGGRCVGIAAGG